MFFCIKEVIQRMSKFVIDTILIGSWTFEVPFVRLLPDGQDKR